MAGERLSVARIVAIIVDTLVVLPPVFAIFLVTVFGSDMRRALVGQGPEEGDSPPAQVQVEQVDGARTVVIDWDLQPGPLRKSYHGSVPVTVRVESPKMEYSKHSDVLVLWGPWFAARAPALKTGQGLQVFPSAPGQPRAFVRRAEGAAELPCYRSTDPLAPDQLKFHCSGRLEAGGGLRLPPPPSCPDSRLAGLYRVLSPGACLGLTAVELSRLPLHLNVHPSPTTDVVEVHPPRGGRYRLSGPVGKPFEELETVGEKAAWPEIAALLAKELGPPRPVKPTGNHRNCPETPSAADYGDPSGPSAHVELCTGFRVTFRPGVP